MRAVIFDLDDTLVIDEAVSREALAETARRAALTHGVEHGRFARDAAAHAKRLWAVGPSHAYCRAIGISAFECLWGKFTGTSPELTQLREWSARYRVQVFDLALREQMVDHGHGEDDLAEIFSAQRRKLQRRMPDAQEVLATLARDHALALLTNGAPDLQREKLAASGLERFFQVVAVSGEVGIGKPRAEIFEQVLAGLGVTAGEAIMVGNSLERDIAGARNAGVRSVWLRVPGAEEHDDVTPDHTIVGLRELPALIARSRVTVTL